MEALNRPIESWINHIRVGMVRLPRFQRAGNAWNLERVKSFLDAVLCEHPLGVFLVLDVGGLDKSPFLTKPIEGTINNGEQCLQHLLDGQQRLTALFRAFEDNYPKHAYYVEIDFSGNLDRDQPFKFKGVEKFLKKKGGMHQNPTEEYKANLIPISILAPGEKGLKKSIEWKQTVCDTLDQTEKKQLDHSISNLREIISKTQIPYLSIDSGMVDQAIDIFININTSGVQLTPFDIATACCEQGISESLRDYVDEVQEKNKLFAELEGNGLGETILKIACVMQGLRPKSGNYRDLCFKTFKKDWGLLLKGINWTEAFLKHQGKSGIQNNKWLPSKVPLRVLPALQLFNFKRTDKPKMEKLMRVYLWRSFLTKRYDRQSDDRLFDDFEILKAKLKNRDFNTITERKDCIFNEEKYKLHMIDDLVAEEWPTGRGILKKAILAVCVLKGAKGIENDTLITAAVEGNERAHHHIFPKDIWDESYECNHALNCMMLESSANSSWGNSWPRDYLNTVLKAMQDQDNTKKKKLKERLETHMLPAEYLMRKNNPKKMTDKQKVYEEFLHQRAKMVFSAMEKLYQGEEI